MKIVCIAQTFSQDKSKKIEVGTTFTLHTVIQRREELFFELVDVTYVPVNATRSRHHRFIPRHFTTLDGYFAHLLIARTETQAAKIFGANWLYLFGFETNAQGVDLVRCRVYGQCIKQPDEFRTLLPLSMFAHYQKPVA